MPKFFVSLGLTRDGGLQRVSPGANNSKRTRSKCRSRCNCHCKEGNKKRRSEYDLNAPLDHQIPDRLLLDQMLPALKLKLSLPSIPLRPLSNEAETYYAQLSAPHSLKSTYDVAGVGGVHAAQSVLALFSSELVGIPKLEEVATEYLHPQHWRTAVPLRTVQDY